MGLQLLPTPTVHTVHTSATATPAAPAGSPSPCSAHTSSSAAAFAAPPAVHALAASTPPTERSKSPTTSFRRDATGNAVYDMRHLLGVEVTVDEARRVTRGKKKAVRAEPANKEDEENTWFFETVEIDEAGNLSEDEGAKGHAYATSPSQPARSSHHRAVASQPTLLPDSGAVTNLIGSLRAKEFSKAARSLGQTVSWTKLSQPRIVSGVGGTGSACQYLLTVSGRVGPKTILRYRAPVISGSSEGVPALLGLQEQTAARAVLLPQSKRLMILPPQCTEQDIRFPEGTACVNLEVAPSGHLLIPFLRSLQAQDRSTMGKHDGASRDTNHHCHWGTVPATASALMT
eukprot:5949178-Amphidinium_carterae.1